MLKPRIARRLPLCEIAAVHELVESGQAIGIVVVEPEKSR